jgi:MoxR-like ATPase
MSAPTLTSPPNATPIVDAPKLLAGAVGQLNQVILGKDRQIRLGLACLLARGHLLIEDIPGVGKTTLAHALAQTLGLSYQRIQFTSDLLPADIIGISIFDRDSSSFRFHKGPIFSHLVLADEVNRATPKAQSALLEAMEEHQVTADGQTYPLYQIGTFPLPESQLDRFLMRIDLGYPDAQLERQLLQGRDRRDLLSTLAAALSPQQLLLLQTKVPAVHASDALLDYVQAIVKFTRESPLFEAGLSPRASIALLRAAQAWSLMHGHIGVLPEDVQAVLPGVVGHRLTPRDETAFKGAAAIGERVLKSVAVP